MSPTPDTPPRSTDSTDGRMRKRRVDKRYDPETGSLANVTIQVGDRRGTYRLEFDHVSHGRLTLQRVTTPDGQTLEADDPDVSADIQEAMLVASRAAWDERLGTETPLTGTPVDLDIDLYDDIDPEGYVQSPESGDLPAEGGD